MTHYRYRVTVILPNGSSGRSVVVDALDGRQAITFAALARRQRARRPKPRFLTEWALPAVAERLRETP
jgi:hypothetical protein